MKHPVQPFHKHAVFRDGTKVSESSCIPSKLKMIQSHIDDLNRLTGLALPVLLRFLPAQNYWQVASLDSETLSIATEHFAAASSLRYIQHQVIKALQQIPEFATVRHLKVVIENQPKPKTVSREALPTLSPEVRQMLDDAASMFQDRDISETFKRMARNQR